MITYWNSLNERERWLVSVGTIATIIYLFYLLIYSPITTAVADKTKLLTENQKTLAWMQQVKQQRPNQTKSQSTTSSKLLTLIATQLNAPPLQRFPYQLQQTSQGDIQLSFDTVPYKAFLTWLWSLNTHYAISLKQITMEKTTTLGIVKLTVIIATK